MGYFYLGLGDGRVVFRKQSRHRVVRVLGSIAAELAHWWGLCRLLGMIGLCLRDIFPTVTVPRRAWIIHRLRRCECKTNDVHALTWFSQKWIEETQFHKDNSKVLSDNFHMKKNHEKITEDKKIIQTRTWAKSNFYRSAMRKVAQSCPLAQKLGLLERFFHPAHAGIKRKTVKRYKRALPKVSPRQA